MQWNERWRKVKSRSGEVISSSHMGVECRNLLLTSNDLWTRPPREQYRSSNQTTNSSLWVAQFDNNKLPFPDGTRGSNRGRWSHISHREAIQPKPHIMNQRLNRSTRRYIITAQRRETFVCSAGEYNGRPFPVYKTTLSVSLSLVLDWRDAVQRPTDGHRPTAPPCHCRCN